MGNPSTENIVARKSPVKRVVRHPNLDTPKGGFGQPGQIGFRLIKPFFRDFLSIRHKTRYSYYKKHNSRHYPRRSLYILLKSGIAKAATKALRCMNRTYYHFKDFIWSIISCLMMLIQRLPMKGPGAGTRKPDYDSRSGTKGFAGTRDLPFWPGGFFHFPGEKLGAGPVWAFPIWPNGIYAGFPFSGDSH